MLRPGAEAPLSAPALVWPRTKARTKGRKKVAPATYPKKEIKQRQTIQARFVCVHLCVLSFCLSEIILSVLDIDSVSLSSTENLRMKVMY